MATSRAVITVSTTAIARYSLAPGCACSRGPGGCPCSAMWPPLLDQIHQCEDRDPHHVDEVPVEAGDLDVQRLLLRDLAAHREREQGPEPDHAHRHVRAVK